MAIGDDALAAGMTLVNGNAANSAPALDDYINETRDEVARRTNLIPISKGGTGATTAGAARTALGIDLGAPNAAAPNKVPVYNAAAQLTTADPTLGGHAASKQYVDAATAAAASDADLAYVQQGNMTSDVYNRTLGGSYRVCYVSSAGQLGWVPSSRRFKKNICPAAVDVDAVLGMELVTFLYKAQIDTDRLGEQQYGLIAEQLDELGLHWLVDYDPTGHPEGVRYDRIAIALLPVVQAQEARIDALEARLEALEAR